MAEWISNMREMMLNFVCGEDSPTTTSPVSLEGCGEVGVVSSDHPLPSSTMIQFAIEDSSDDSSLTSDLEDGSPSLRLRGGKDQQKSANGNSKSQRQVKIHSKEYSDIPVRTKAAQGVFLGCQLYVGGGYVEDSKISRVIYKYDPIFELWDPLPSCPVKLFGMSSFNQQLVVVGGREAGRLGPNSSNKLFTWDKDGRSWNSSIPSMTFARTSPVVINYDRFLIVAGGNKGSLDYNTEVYDSHTKRWTSAPPLPVKCFPLTSAVTGQSWFLLNQEEGTIACADIPCLLRLVSGVKDITDDTQLEDGEERTRLWNTLPKPPCEPTQITTVNGRLLAIVNESNPVRVSSYCYDGETRSWSYSYKLPNLCGHSSTLPDNKDGTYLFGGEGGAKRYSNKLYRLTLRTSETGYTKNSKPPLTFSL